MSEGRDGVQWGSGDRWANRLLTDEVFDWKQKPYHANRVRVEESTGKHVKTRIGEEVWGQRSSVILVRM